ncbi:CRISPR-associated Cas1 family protein [Rhodothalassium salexigens DSM 2132]|uniref:CRISPR-associated endonuclease Cas1 n=1 Tax=Rhodothalassium salexigens DSM 2132 TaxID=1188247 RepID=A0A4R2P484_RHOSA|nr:type II CRISPR-associated endonuclease Cas1 [Rhodothalassium salexigens]MBB4212811.1 CRISPR-associated protein Cas1 [Rhodothalassium salexigens DSM 2132]MBK1638952.1 subtype II CRISPR-associated endonuclease Cas1 [Rhodothalassium salexigens DSM 2132]TCP29543.1 CRISPR-associated Cas1 family protein [Rhodothalassium salexigens DSM 2132]
MYPRIVEIAEDGRHLAKHRGFLVVQQDGAELARVPLDDVAAVIATAHGLTYSNALVCALAERGVAFVLCGPNHMPVGFLWPAESHHEQAGRIADQINASKPTRKRLWAQLVAAKVTHQGAILRSLGKASEGFLMMARGVRSGDPDNVEAQAARRYWARLFGSDFRRDRSQDGVNALLNYAYTVLRAGTARAVMGAGLHPSIGLGHSRRTNSFLLVDDLMEPFRPMADREVCRLVEAGATTVDRTAKKALAALLSTDMSSPDGISPVYKCLERTAWSLAACLGGRAKVLEIARPPLPLEG